MRIKKLLITMLMLTMINSQNINSLAYNNENEENLLTYESDINITGTFMTAETFKNTFSGEPSQRVTTMARSSTASSNINISNIAISGRDISLLIKLSYNS